MPESKPFEIYRKILFNFSRTHDAKTYKLAVAGSETGMRQIAVRCAALTENRNGVSAPDNAICI
jgi:hypothetical protein